MFFVSALALAAPLAWADAPYIPATQTKAEVQPAITTGTPCGEGDNPDTPARAFRMNGKTILIAGSQYENYRESGPDLDSLGYDCDKPVLTSLKDPSPKAYADEEWIHSTYAKGDDVLALLHVEYRGDKHRTESGCRTGTYKQCWWSMVTTATSKDGGLTFSRPEDPATRPIIRNSFAYQPMVGHEYGFMNPSNIFAEDGYIYAFVYNRQNYNQKEGNYLVRHADNADWNDGAWEVMRNGKWLSVNETINKPRKSRFSHTSAVGNIVNVGVIRTTPLEQHFSDTTPMRAYGLVKHTPSGKYVALLTSKHPKDQASDGFYIATADCISCSWSLPRQIAHADYRKDFTCKQDKNATNVEIYRYGSLLDPASTDQNYQTVGDNPYLFTTRLTYPDCKNGKATTELVKFRVPLGKLIEEMTPKTEGQGSTSPTAVQ